MQLDQLKRRDFITLLGSAAAAWPLTARAQQSERVRRVGVLVPYAETHAEAKTRISAFGQELQKLGWSEGRNVIVESCYGGGGSERLRALRRCRDRTGARCEAATC
jgi:hypothetical protein